MTNVTISLVLAYILLGISQVTEDLAADPLRMPGWAFRPTFGKMLLIGATWFTRPFIEAVHSEQVALAREVAFAIPKVLLPFVMTTALAWVCILTAEYWLDNLVLRIVAVGVLMIVGGRFVVPWLNLLLMPVILLIALPLDLLFPLKKSDKGKNARWCKNCIHYRRSKRYEYIPGGLYLSEKMPPLDALPCAIAKEALDAWEDFYNRELNHRTLYPLDCSHFERRV